MPSSLLIRLLYSGPTEIGMSRLSLSDTDRQARDWFAETTKALGCKVHYDAMGNQFAVRPGMLHNFYNSISRLMITFLLERLRMFSY